MGGVLCTGRLRSTRIGGGVVDQNGQDCDGFEWNSMYIEGRAIVASGGMPLGGVARSPDSRVMRGA